MNNGFDLERQIRLMIVNVIKDYNEELLREICRTFGLDTEKILKKYLVPYYYMPVIERDLKKLNI
tara:strand:+ start:284 stop:478 length:195 start_codon:yes stop_codon:yes gene_type:complete